MEEIAVEDGFDKYGNKFYTAMSPLATKCVGRVNHYQRPKTQVGVVCVYPTREAAIKRLNEYLSNEGDSENIRVAILSSKLPFNKKEE